MLVYYCKTRVVCKCTWMHAIIYLNISVCLVIEAWDEKKERFNEGAN